jgi:hypothetical protein
VSALDSFYEHQMDPCVAHVQVISVMTLPDYDSTTNHVITPYYGQL